METLNKISEDKFQLVCNKQNMILKVNKEENIYMLDFEMDNKNFDLSKLMDFKIYDLIQQLNNDIIEKIEIIKQNSENEIDLLFIFKRFGQSAGIPQKYLILKTIRNVMDNLILFKSTDANIELEKMNNHIAEKMKCNFAELTIIPYQNKLRLNYKFSIDIKEDLPIYMENIMGLMMKKIFYRLKLFIEKVDKI